MKSKCKCCDGTGEVEVADREVMGRLIDAASRLDPHIYHMSPSSVALYFVLKRLVEKDGGDFYGAIEEVTTEMGA